MDVVWVLFYLGVLFFLLVLFYLDHKDYDCSRVPVTRRATSDYCQCMLGSVPTTQDSEGDRQRKINALLERLTHIVFWRRALLIAMISSLLVGFYQTNGWLLPPVSFCVYTVFIFVVCYLMFMWFSFHYLYPLSLIVRS